MINVGVTAYNIDNLGIKAILKTTGKATAKEMIKSSDGQRAGGKEAPKQEHQEKSNGKEVQKREEEKKN